VSINITHVAKNSIRFSLVGIGAAALGLPVSIYVTAILSPEQYGIYGVLILCLTYASLIGPGFLMTGKREIPVLLGQEEVGKAKSVQNISMSGELLYTILPLSAIIIASFFFSQPIMKFGLLIVAAVYLSTQLASFWGGIIFIREKFGIAVKGNLILAILVPILIAATINWIGVYSLVISPLIASIIVWIFYLRTSSVEFHFTWDSHELIRMFKIGIVLQLTSLVYWGFRLADRTIVASTLSLDDMGLYTAAAIFVAYAQVLPTDFTRVLTPIMWRESISGSFKDASRIAVYVALATSILIPLMQLLFYLIRELLTAQYVNSIPVFNILSYNICLAMVCTAPAIILSSKIVNKQNIVLVVYSVGLALQIALALLLIKLGHGIAGVALAAVIVQAMITIATFVLAHRYMFDKMREALSRYFLIILPIVVAVLFYFIHSYMNVHIEGKTQFVAISLSAQVVIWSLVIYLVYRQYVSVGKVKALINGLLVRA
jgi:O-antigen/teichoic acid export membrane protein